MKKIREKISFIKNKSKKYKKINNKISKRSPSKFSKKHNNKLSKFKLICIIIILLFIILCLALSKLLYKNYRKYKMKKYFIPNTRRLAIIFGTRPEAIKLFPLIKELKENKNFICIIINTGQHKEMLKQIFESIKIDKSIDFNLNLMKNNQSLAELTSKAILELNKIFDLIIPDAVIIQGDTTTAFSAAVSAFYKKIPIFHVEAGLRTHNLYYPYPEEFNRITIDDISTLYFAYWLGCK